MKKSGLSHIRKWLWLYVCFVIITTLAVYLFVYHEISSALAVLPNVVFDPKLDGTILTHTTSLLAGLKLRILLVLTIGLFIILFCSIVWLRSAVRQINRPIHAIRRAVFRLAQGKLNETVTIESNDEFGQIGANINELAANLQELLLYIWKQTGQCMNTMEKIKGQRVETEFHQSSDQTRMQLDELAVAVENLRDMAKAYVFYDVRLEGEQTVAINHPGREVQPSVAPRESLSGKD